MNDDYEEVDVVEEAVEAVQISHLPAITRPEALIGMADQVSVARRHPRAMTEFVREATDMATMDEETAAECLYTLLRSGKTISGPSVRLAEILMYAFRNARAEASVIDEGETHLTAQGVFFDLERNVAIRKLVKRRIVDKNGKRYNVDMIQVTGNAANSIALRNVVFAGIPKAIWRPIYDKARKASLGEAGTLTQKRQRMVDWFAKAGVSKERVFALLEVKGINDVGEEQLIELRGLVNSIKEGEVSVEDTFPPEPLKEPKPKGKDEAEQTELV